MILVISILALMALLVASMSRGRGPNYTYNPPAERLAETPSPIGRRR